MVYFSMENFIQPLDGNTIKQFLYHEYLMINNQRSVIQHTQESH